ncbi:MAG TPA: CHRD domain-containing protein [Roseiflexaceae bacterium]|nr:CHRD domain-containing protein [Roseiflexaceae bacterium]
MRKVGLLVLVLVALLATFGTTLAINRNYSVHLSGDEEVPVRVTGAQGQAIFHVSKDGGALEYKLIVANIENVVAAHIHCGAAGVNGPVGVTLFMGTPGGGRVSGVLSEGLVLAPDSGNACGWTNLDAVVAGLNSGNTYVNVHTNDGVAPTNTGPGDFPGGEIRGQVR